MVLLRIASWSALAALASCAGTPATPTSLPSPKSKTVVADTPAERALQLTRSLPQRYREACQRLQAYAPSGADACPPLVPVGYLQVRSAGPVGPSDGYEDSYVLDLGSGSLGTIRGRAVDTNGGHWTVSAAWGPTTRKLLDAQLHAALGVQRARCRHIRLAGGRVEACRVPATDDGYYSGHIAYAWEHLGVIIHVSIHGHANEPRLALMMAALIRREEGR
jgi:hypothetical protein